MLNPEVMPTAPAVQDLTTESADLREHADAIRDPGATSRAV